MAVTHNISARLNEEVVNGVSIPKSVNIKGAGFLAPSALVDVALEVLKTYTGVEFPDYVPIMPDWGMRSDDMDIAVVYRRY